MLEIGTLQLIVMAIVAISSLAVIRFGYLS